MKFDQGAPLKESQKIADDLYIFLASTYVLYLKTQTYHWNVKGPNFYGLHLLFQSQYEDMAEAIDEIAERIKALDVHVDGSMAKFLEKSHIKEGNHCTKDCDMIKDLVQAHEEMSNLGTPFIPKFQELGDEVSADMLISRLTFHEKSRWMLRSHL